MLDYIAQYDPTIKKNLEEMNHPDFDFTTAVNKVLKRKNPLWKIAPQLCIKTITRLCVLWVNASDEQITEWARHSSKNGVKLSMFSRKRQGTVKGFQEIGSYSKQLQKEMISILYEDMKRQEEEGSEQSEKVSNKPKYDPTSRLVILEMNDKNFNFTTTANKELLKQSILWVWFPRLNRERILRYATLWANATDQHIKEWARYAEEHGVHDSKFSFTKLQGDYNYFLEMGEEIRKDSYDAIAEANKD